MKTLYFNDLVSSMCKRLILLLVFVNIIPSARAQDSPRGTVVISKRAVSAISPGADFTFTTTFPGSDRFTLNDDPAFISMQDVGMGKSNTIWAIGAPEVEQENGNVYYRTPGTSGWVQVDGMGTRIDGTVSGMAILTNKVGDLFAWRNNRFELLSVGAQAVDVGANAANTGFPYALVFKNGCFILARYEGLQDLVTYPNICGNRLDVGPNGDIYVLSELAGKVYRITVSGTTATIQNTYDAQGFRDITVAADGRVWAVDRSRCYYLENNVFVEAANSSGVGEGRNRSGISAGSDGDTPIMTLNAEDDAPLSTRGQIVQRREDGSWLNSHKVRQSGSGNSIIVNVAPGTYNVTENPGNWKLTGINAAGGSVAVVKNLQTNSASIRVFAGQTVHVEFVNTGYDYGDAPDSYGTLSASGGAVHEVGPALALGNTVDVDANGVPGPLAEGDNTGGQNDEDGISEFPTISPSVSTTFINYTVKVSARNTTGSTANLCGWIDWNNNGNFDSEEGVCTTLAASATEATLVWPTSTLSGPTGTTGTYARFRLSTNSLITTSVTGLATDGEVEDYFIPFSGSLPVTLMAFDGAVQENHVTLKWATAGETNADRFEIQHSTNGKNWDLIGSVIAKGESSVQSNYAFGHEAPVKGQNFYRLKMIDYDKTFSLSKIINVLFDKTPALTAYPNPASNRILIGNDELVKQVTLHAVSGVKVFEIKGRFYDGIDVSKLSEGIYMMTIIHLDGTVSMQKVLIARE